MLFAPTPYFLARAIQWSHLNFSPANPCCHGNEFLDKIGYNSAPVKDNCSLFALNPLFSGPRYPMVSLNFSPANPRCHGNEFWDKIGYNSAPVKDNYALFAPTPLFSGPRYPMHPRKNHTLSIRKNLYYLATKNISTFSNIAIIN